MIKVLCRGLAAALLVLAACGETVDIATPPPPPTAPAAPTNVSAVAGVRSATVSWTAPEGEELSYIVTAAPGGFTATVENATTATLSELANGATYAFTVRAAKGGLVSEPSAPSAPVTTPDLPDRPLDVVAVRGNAEAKLSWTAPASDGGSALTGYTVQIVGGTAAPIAVGETETSTTVKGLSNGTAYSFSIFASNAVGDGQPALSASVVPAAVPDAPTAVAAAPEIRSAKVSWTASRRRSAPSR